jgi:hypothetical protein
VRYPSLALLLLLLLLAPSPGSASEMVIIKYDVSGELRSGSRLVGPVFGLSTPGPAGVGSSVTFRFTPNPSGETAVDILSLVQSHGITDAHYTGYMVRFLQSPIVGGVLSNGVAVGTRSGSANNYAVIHCLDSEGLPDCFRFTERPQISIPFTHLRLGVPVYFGRATLNYGNVASGWIFKLEPEHFPSQPANIRAAPPVLPTYKPRRH